MSTANVGGQGRLDAAASFSAIVCLLLEPILFSLVRTVQELASEVVGLLLDVPDEPLHAQEAARTGGKVHEDPPGGIDLDDTLSGLGLDELEQLVTHDMTQSSHRSIAGEALEGVSLPELEDLVVRIGRAPSGEDGGESSEL